MAVGEGGGYWIDGPNDRVWIDGFLDEALSIGAETSGYPVESGRKVIDHAHVRPARLTIHIVVSNSPTRTPLSHGDGAQVIGLDREIEGARLSPVVLGVPLTSAPSTAQAFGADPRRESLTVRLQGLDRAVDRVSAVADALAAIVEYLEPVTIFGTRRVYRNMLITSVDEEVTTQRGGYHATVTAEELAVAHISQAAPPRITNARPHKQAKNGGRKEATASGAASGGEPPPNSFLWKLRNARPGS